MNNPVFSIITATYKRPKLLERAIRSVIAQTFCNYEHIIIDDANEAVTENLVRDFKDPRIVFLKHKKQQGAGASYNTGIKFSRGKFIIVLGDDDELFPPFLEKMQEQFSNGNENIDFIWTGIVRVKDMHLGGEEALMTQTWPARFKNKEKGLAAATSIGNGFGLCVKRECIEAIGLYDENLKFGQDTEFLFRLAKKFEFRTIPEVLVKIHNNNNYHQLTNSQNNIVRLKLYKKILWNHKDFLALHPWVYCIHYQRVVDLSYKLGLRIKGRKALMSIIEKKPLKLINYADLLFYELVGKNTMTVYSQSLTKKILHSLKIYRRHETFIFL